MILYVRALPVESPALSAGPLGATCRTNTVSMGSAFCLSMSSTWWSRPFTPGPEPGLSKKKKIGQNIKHTINTWRHVFIIWVLPEINKTSYEPQT